MSPASIHASLSESYLPTNKLTLWELSKKHNIFYTTLQRRVENGTQSAEEAHITTQNFTPQQESYS